MNFIGNQPIANFLQLSFKNGTFSHAYCLIGPSQIGKRTLANQLAAQILEIEVKALNTNPDYVYVERLEDEKTGKKKKEISADQIRQVREKFYNSSWLNGYKVIVLDEAELLNEESANGFLKILEEPPAKSIIFILTENDNLLLPTIRSRCQCLELSAVSDASMSEFLKSLDCHDNQAQEIIKLSWGRPGKALELLSDSEKYSQNFDEQRRFEKIIKSPIYERWSLMEDVLSEKGGLIKTKEKLEPILESWIMFWRDLMINDLKNSKKYQQNIDQTTKTKNLLSANVNSKLAIEQLLTNIY
ncbi:MAG: AAA family ATPase [Candidatus Magasanikbacteria bacterium]|nr:AAA family ATPase [Candidatus Magasanikbacteria bacterium]